MDKKKLGIIGGVAAVVIIGVIIAIVAVNSGKSDDGGKKDGGSSQEQKKDDDKKDNKLSADALKNIDETISFGDYDSQYTLSKAIQNGEKLGKVVKIDGTVSHFGKGMSYNIGQKKSDGTGYIGTAFTIDDGEEADYPADGDHVVLTGIVVVDDTGFVFTLKTLKAYVEKK